MSFNEDTPSFRCTLCDFDLCYSCAEKTSIQQKDKEMDIGTDKETDPFKDFSISVSGNFNYMPGFGINHSKSEACFHFHFGMDKKILLEQFEIETISINHRLVLIFVSTLHYLRIII